MNSSCKRPHTCTVKPQCVCAVTGWWLVHFLGCRRTGEWMEGGAASGWRPTVWMEEVKRNQVEVKSCHFLKFSVLTETPQTKAELFFFLLLCCLPTMLCSFFLEWLMERLSFLLPRSAHSGFNMIHFDKNNVSHKHRSIINLQVWEVKPTLRHQNMQLFDVQQRLQQWARPQRLTQQNKHILLLIGRGHRRL